MPTRERRTRRRRRISDSERKKSRVEKRKKKTNPASSVEFLLASYSCQERKMKLNCVKPNYTKRFSGAALFICFYNALPTPPIALRPTNYAFIRYANISSYSYVQLRVLPPRWPLSLRVCVKVVCPWRDVPRRNVQEA